MKVQIKHPLFFSTCSPIQKFSSVTLNKSLCRRKIIKSVRKGTSFPPQSLWILFYFNCQVEASFYYVVFQNLI